ncbi:MAG: transposase [Nanoarchaeota archaeon]
MARPLRIEYEGAFYHVTARGNERRNIYFNKTDYEKFKEKIAEAKERYGILLHCYVLMGNHYHLIIETPEANLGKAMHHINGSYTTYINIKRKRSGHLFQGRYKAIVIDKDSYLLELSRYIHLNPVRAGMVDKPEAYPHSSYKTYISGDKEEIVTQDLIWGMLSKKKGEAMRRYQEFVERAIGEKQESPLKEVYGGMILGKVSFIKEVLQELKEGHLQKEEVSENKWGRVYTLDKDFAKPCRVHSMFGAYELKDF